MREYMKEFDDIVDVELLSKINYICSLVDIGIIDSDQAIHEIKELRSIYKA